MRKREKIIRAVCKDRGFSPEATNKVIDYVDTTLELHRIGEELIKKRKKPNEWDIVLIDKQGALLRDLEFYGQEVLKTGMFLGFCDWNKTEKGGER